MEHIDSDSSSLTVAVSSVLGRDLPAELRWKHLTNTNASPTAKMYSMGCFEAVSTAPDEEHLYSVNLLTGAFLLDGSPTSSLPADILGHTLFKRTFGQRDFEICVSADGSLKTNRKLRGCHYNFLLVDGSLKVTDHAPGEPVLELLDGSCPETWGAQLPVRLRRLHSHWLDRTTRSVFLRSAELPARDTSFMARPEGDDVGSIRCYQVPKHLQSCTARQLLALPDGSLTDTLVLWDAPPISGLSKFEPLVFVHFFWDGRRYRVELPRYKLEFTLGNDVLLESCDFSGCHLNNPPQLDGTLLGFTDCLVLAPGSSLFDHSPWHGGLVKVLVPIGDVQRSDKGTVSIIGSNDNDCAASREAYIFDVHGRFGDLRAPSIAARLQLAALYAACDDRLLPEPSFAGDVMCLRSFSCANTFRKQPLSFRSSIRRLQPSFPRRSPTCFPQIKLRITKQSTCNTQRVVAATHAAC